MVMERGFAAGFGVVFWIVFVCCWFGWFGLFGGVCDVLWVCVWFSYLVLWMLVCCLLVYLVAM